MRGVRRGVTLVTVVLAVLGICCGAAAQVATTTIRDTVYRADGTPASGTVVVSWPTFTTAAGQAVASGNTSAAIGPNGALSLTLTPNANATPTGTYYTAVLHLDDGTTSQQYWVIPVSATPVTLAAIENQVLPSSVAMQTASRAYVDAKIAAVNGSGGTGTTGSYVPTTGGTMTGPLLLPADPVTPNQAADKHYVDLNITSVAAGVGQKVSLVPTVTQTIAQPVGTQLGVNAFNGELFANGYQTGPGGNGIASALSAPGCGSGCRVVAEPNYNSSEPVVVQQIPDGGHVVDLRHGANTETFVNPLSKGNVGESLSQYASAPLNSGAGAFTLNLSNTALSGGTNQLPGGIEDAPYGKSTYGVSAETGNYYTLGQHINDEHVINCYAVGDCLQGSYILTNSGGYRDWADEGAHPFDLDVTEDVREFQGTCASGCTAGSTSVFVNATADGGTQGEGRFLIDKNPSKTISTGQIVSNGGDTLAAIAVFSGTNFPASVFLQTAAIAQSQANNIAPGTVTLPIATSGVPSGVAVNTSQLPSPTGVACVMDTNTGGRFPNFEMASYSVVDATHITLTLNKAHAPGALLGVGGMCGYGIEQTADTVGSIRQIFPVVGTVTPTELYYASSGVPILGDSGYPSTSAFANISGQVASISRHANVVTATFTQNLPADPTGLTMTVSGVADGTYNGSFPVTSTASNQVTYQDNGPDGTSSGGTISFLNGGYVLYPMAEVLSVYNPSTKVVDGEFTLGANTVQWAPGDPVEEPHFYMSLTSADTEFIAQYMPRPIQNSTPGKQYQGNVGPGMRGWVIQNAVPANSYLGGGGTHQLPDDAYEALGVWGTDFEVDAGANSVIRAHCNLHGCNRWDSGYALFDLDSAAGRDFLYYAPQTSTMFMTLGGAPSITFGPNSITAGTVTATTIAGGSITGTSVKTLSPGDEAAGVFAINNHTTDAIQVQSQDAAGYSAIGFLDNTGAVAGGFGYSNPAAVSVPGTIFFTSVFHNMEFSTDNSASASITIDTAGNVTLPGSVKVNSSGVISASQVSVPVLRSGTASNTDIAGRLTLNAGSTSSSSYSFTGGYGSAPVCIVEPQSASAAAVAALGAIAPQVSATALSVSVQNAPASGITFGYQCVGGN